MNGICLLSFLYSRGTGFMSGIKDATVRSCHTDVTLTVTESLEGGTFWEKGSDLTSLLDQRIPGGWGLYEIQWEVKPLVPQGRPSTPSLLHISVFLRYGTVLVHLGAQERAFSPCRASFRPQFLRGKSAGTPARIPCHPCHLSLGRGWPLPPLVSQIFQSQKLPSVIFGDLNDHIDKNLSRNTALWKTTMCMHATLR